VHSFRKDDFAPTSRSIAPIVGLAGLAASMFACTVYVFALGEVGGVTTFVGETSKTVGATPIWPLGIVTMVSGLALSVLTYATLQPPDRVVASIDPGQFSVLRDAVRDGGRDGLRDGAAAGTRTFLEENLSGADMAADFSRAMTSLLETDVLHAQFKRSINSLLEEFMTAHEAEHKAAHQALGDRPAVARLEPPKPAPRPTVRIQDPRDSFGPRA